MMEEIYEKLQDTLSLINMLENDMEMEEPDGIYKRVVRVIHRLLRESCDEFQKRMHK